MGFLDNQNKREKIDSDNMLSNIESFPDQIERALLDGAKFTIPTPFINIKNVAIAGMGGSGIASKIVSRFAISRSNMPIAIIDDYNIPAYLNSQSLLIAVSVSGETEETITSFVQAAERGMKLLAIGSGNSLEALSRKYKNPFMGLEHPSPPRTFLPYILTSILVILGRLNIIEDQRENIKESILMLKSLVNKIGWGIPSSQNSAKQLAEKLVGKIPIIYGSGIMAAIAERWKQQFNENSKNLAFFEFIPEVCHNGIEGWQFPKKAGQNVFAILIQSKYDLSPNKLRHSAILQLLQRQGIPHEPILLHPSGNLISEIFQTTMFGDYVSYYLSLLNGINPTPVEKIEFIKQKIAEG